MGGARPESDETTDAALLARFIAERDETAFAALVDRHGPLVLHVCRRVLVDFHDAEDAFQATFLILARKAATVRPREALPAWLYGVARRVALKARSAKARHFREARSRAMPTEARGHGILQDPRVDPLAELSVRELIGILDEELERLPEVYRLPLILCGLESRSLEEAARQLGWTVGSVKGRLQRGRARLHARLVRRGATLSVALAAAEVTRGAALAAVVARLLAATARSALAFAAGQPAAAGGASSGAVALATQTLRGMALSKLKILASLLVTTCLLTSGLVMDMAAPSPPPEAAPIRSAVFVNSQAGAAQNEATAPIEVSGQVFDPSGKPYEGAKLYVGYTVRRSAPDTHLPQTTPLFRTTSGADGRFRFAFATSQLDARWLDNSRPAVIAVAAGYGPDWAQIAEFGERAELSLKLVEELPLNGRILDQNRKPVAGARILVLDVGSDSTKGVTPFAQGNSRRWQGALPEQPPSVMTDADGRFRLTGLGRDRIIGLSLEGPAIPHTSITAITRAAKSTAGVHGANFDYVASAARSVRGVVRDKATGRPVAGVKMSAQHTTSTALTDTDGRFEILGCPKLHPVYFVKAQPQAGQPYFAAAASVPERAGLDPLTLDFDLVSGIPLSGRVTDQSTQKPPRAAVVEYYPLFPNPHSTKIAIWCNMPASSSVIGPDGSYSLVVLPGPGVVCVTAYPRGSYAVAVVDENDVENLFQDGKHHGWAQRLATDAGAHGSGILWVHKYNALYLINPDERAELQVLNLSVQSARTIQGTVAGPDGKPLTGVEVVGLSALPDDELLESASFTVLGLNPRSSRELLFLHRGKSLGKAMTIRGDETGPLTVQLIPCGSITGRLVDRHRKPVPRVTLSFSPAANGPAITAETDPAGRFRGALLPGQKYSLWLFSSRRLLKDVGKVEVASGRIKDLGDLPLGD